jgi:signal transduction histidine kinase
LSHGLRTPLNAILGWTKLPGDAGAIRVHRRALGKVGGTRKSTRLVEDLLGVRITSGLRLDLKPSIWCRW